MPERPIGPLFDSDPVPEDVVLPCGCFLSFAIVNGEKTMTISPCRPSCVNLANALDLGREGGKNIEYRRG